MNLRRSRLLEQLRQGESTGCAKINLSDPRVVEICALSGVPAVWLCNEHVPNDWLNLENQIRAASKHDIDTIVRVSKGSYSDYIKPLEADATGIMVPHVETADEARRIVEWARFHPVGKRPIDGGNADAHFCQVPMKEYIKHGNTERFIVIQIESPEAVENVEEIAAVEGFDILLFGAGDFGHRIGRLGEFGHPDIVSARKRIGAAARANNKYGMLATMMADRSVLEDEGYQIFGIGADVIAIAEYMKNQWASFRHYVRGQPDSYSKSSKG